MIVGEFFTQGPRSAAVSLAVLVNWTANVAIGLGFPPLFKYVTKDWTFALFALLLLFFCVFTFAFMPETKGKTAEEMAIYFRSNIFAFKETRKPNEWNESKISFEKDQNEIGISKTKSDSVSEDKYLTEF